MFRWDATGALAKIGVPVLVMGGALDIVTKPQASRTIGETREDMRVIVVKDVNHMGFLEGYETYNDAIGTFATEVNKHGSRRDPAPLPSVV